jgi:hypothetical protein
VRKHYRTRIYIAHREITKMKLFAIANRISIYIRLRYKISSPPLFSRLLHTKGIVYTKKALSTASD